MLTWATRTAPPTIGSNPLAGVKPLRHDSPKEIRPLLDWEVEALAETTSSGDAFRSLLMEKN